MSDIHLIFDFGFFLFKEEDMKRIILVLVLLVCSLSFGQNTKLGEGAGKHLTTGYDNTFYGVNSGYWLTSGFGNILIGFKPAQSLTTAYNNIYIGNNLSPDSVSQSNTLNIGGIIKGNLSSGVVTIPKTAATTISGSITATDSTTSVILKSSDGKKWKIRVNTGGTVAADSTGLN